MNKFWYAWFPSRGQSRVTHVFLIASFLYIPSKAPITIDFVCIITLLFDISSIFGTVHEGDHFNSKVPVISYPCTQSWLFMVLIAPFLFHISHSHLLPYSIPSLQLFRRQFMNAKPWSHHWILECNNKLWSSRE